MSPSRSVTRSTCHACSGRDHAPGAELAAELEGDALGGARQPAGVRARVAGDGEVDVVGVAVQQPVAHRAADQPGGFARERARGPPRAPHSYRRGTRELIPHVTS